jgi:alpha-methylacyl-CoA racemase
MRPLDGVTVLDFTTLLPGPLATLILAEAGAEVIKIERPGMGDEMRIYHPKFGPDSVNFALLNRGKKSLAIDLKAKDAMARLAPLIADADVLVEQFRPGVMDRFGLGWDAVRAINPAIIYASITGYGPSGPRAQVAGHDLNYLGDTGLLALGAGVDGAPVVPPALIADIAAGSYPTVVNVLLALRRRDRTGEGARLDISMCDNLFPLMYWAIGNAQAADQWPRPGGELVTGGSARYRVYRTHDGRHLAAAPLEQRFWDRFCDLIGLERDYRDDARDAEATIARVAEIIAGRDAAAWAEVFAGEDCCCTVVADLRAALDDEHFRARGLFDHKLANDTGGTISALPVPVDDQFRAPPGEALRAPALGEDDEAR